MTRVICPCCNTSQVKSLRPYRGHSHTFSHRNLVECVGCGFTRIDPLPSFAELGTYYGQYWAGRKAEQYFALFAAQAKARVAFIRKYGMPAPQKVLDVGAGYGFMLPALRRQGPEFIYDTVESDPEAVRYLLDQQKARRNMADLKDVREPYDLVILSHILEHVPDPLAYLRNVGDLLLPKGVVFLEMPNQDFLYKDHEEPHLSFFAIQTLSKVLTRAGFETLAIDSCGAEFKPVDPAIVPAPQSGLAMVKNWIPPAAKLFLKRMLGRQTQRLVNYEAFEHYGGQRIWLRALAQKGQHKPC